jgi:hypothetical protein
MKLREESQGSNSGTAATHDSDPRLLNFQLIDGDTMTGEGVVIQELGDTLDLSIAEPPGTEQPGTPGVTGPTIGDLTGGAAGEDINSVIVNAMPTVCTKRLSAGAVSLNLNWSDPGEPVVIDGVGNALTAGFMHTIFQFERVSDPTQHATYDPGECDYVNLGTLADAQGGHGTSEYTVQPAYSFGGRIPDWRLVGIQCQINGGDEFRAFHVTERLDNVNSHFYFSFKPASGNAIPIGGVSLIDGLDTTINPVDQLPEIQAGDHYLVHFVLVSKRIPASVSVPYSLTAANCETVALDHGTEYSNELSLGIGTALSGADLLWAEISEAHGKAIESITYNVTVPFAAGDTAPFTLKSPQSMAITVGVNTAVTIPDVTLSNGPHTLALDHPTTPFTLDFITAMAGNPIEPGWLSGDSSGDLIPIATILIDATNIKANATGGQLLLQAATLHYGTDLLAPYYGFVIGGFTVVHHQPYGPAGLDNVHSLISLAYRQHVNDVINDTPIGILEQLKDTPTGFEDLSPTTGQVITESDELAVEPDLYPKSIPPGPSPGNYPIVMTEPYETRSRNLVGFKFHVFGEVGELTPNYNVMVYGSQGTPNDLETDRLWTRCSMEVSDQSGPFGVVSITPQFSLSPADTVTNMPESFGAGTFIFTPDFNMCPFNYYRLVIWAENPDQMTGLNLQITANAREVL